MRMCIQWSTLGPYHIARLRAAAGIAAPLGIELIGFEIARRDTTYGFRSDNEGDGFTRYTVFPDAVLEDLKPTDIRKAVMKALDELDPEAVAITSYATIEARTCLQWCTTRGRTSILMTATKADDGYRARWRERTKSILLRGYDAAVVGGTPQEDYLVELGFPKEHIFHGYDVVDNDWIARRVSEVQAESSVDEQRVRPPGLETDAPFFLASARMTERKNYPGLLAAYSAYRKLVEKPWRLVALGDGPLRAQVESTIADQSIPGITLAGFRPYDELPEYYAKAGAFVHTAHLDQWGLVVNEAMAAGLPVLISTGSGCVTDLVKDGENGYSFASDDTNTLSRLMAQISSDASLRMKMGQRSREIASEWHPDRFGHSLVDALEVAEKRDRSGVDFSFRLTLNALQRIAMTQDSFHTVRP